MATIYISLGGDLGDPQEQQVRAAGLIEKHIGQVQLKSAFYRTEPWGVERKEPFVNSVLKARTVLDPFQVLDKMLWIEAQLGRVRPDEKNAPRTIDLDLLYYDDLVIDAPGLQLPHSMLHLRRFVLEPLNEISPELFDPQQQLSVSELLAVCPDKGSVQKLECATTILP